jgi:SagB-type dehydrogenase family enzyme
MDRERIGRRFGFLCSRLDDPRRIQLRENRFLKEYHDRAALDDVIEIGHERTKLRRVGNSEIADALNVFEQPLMYSIEYTQDREYPLHEPMPLPEPALPDCLFSEVVRRRRSNRNFCCRALALGEFSTLLFCALGETGQMTIDSGRDCRVDVSLRSVPSGGALHPTRIFVIALQPGDLANGIYHYDAPAHQLETVKSLSCLETEALFAAFPVHPFVVDLASVAALFVITTKFWRTRAKYGPRGYRYCLQEAGAACQNLSLGAASLGLSHVVLGGFYDDELHECLEIDGIDHAVITTVAVGPSGARQETGTRHVDL